MKKNKSAGKRLKGIFILVAALVLLVALAIIVVLEQVLLSSEIVLQTGLQSGVVWMIFFALASIGFGLIMATLLGRIFLNPIDTLIDGMEKLGKGEFSTRINFAKFESMKYLADSFNKLAAELENIEILRSDFTNNFSHELKTPMVSIQSLIGLLKTEDLPKKKRLEYLQIIEEELARLTQMTTNILNLSKFQAQGILTDKKRYNVSEQMRTCVLLLEKKWSKKSLDLSLDFGEFYLAGNEDMLKEVWLNLLDNAIKFSHEKTELKVDVFEDEKRVFVAVENTGETIAEEEKPRIFEKFYQTNGTHKKEGNGIGLSLVKHIVELHGGNIEVESENSVTRFTVSLPKN